MILKQRFSFFVYCCIVTTLSSQSTSIAALDQYIESSRLLYRVPGMTVTIVHNGRVLLAKGYGTRSVSDTTHVSVETLFPMASTTKALTAVAMAILVDEGQINWSDPVVRYLPYFRLSDPYVTSQLTIKDLFTHNSGLPGTDLLWTMWDYSPEEMIKRLRNMPLSYSLRGGYQYQNIMYMTAGILIEKISGIPWEEFVRARIFDPLEMHRTHALRSHAYKDHNRVTPHAIRDDNVIEIIDSAADSIHAAGAAWTCSADVAHWLQLMADSGIYRGQRLISEQSYEMITSPQIIIPRQRFYPSQIYTQPHFRAYGLGWYMHDYHGEKVLFHTGSLNGAVAIAGVIPAHGIGVFISGNLGGAEVRHALMYKIVDTLLGLPSRDWSPDIKNLYENIRNGNLIQKKVTMPPKVADAPPTHPLETFIGQYHDDFLGKLTVEQYKDGLRITTRADRHIVLTHRQYNTFNALIEEYASFEDEFLVDFDIDAYGRPSINLYDTVFKKISP